MPEAITPVLAASLERVEGLLFRKVNTDMNRRMLRLLQRDAAVFFVDGMCSMDDLQRFVMQPAMDAAEQASSGELGTAVLAALPVGECEIIGDFETFVGDLMDGRAMLLVDGLAGALSMDIRGYVRRSVGAPLTESVIMGPHEGFNESLRDNVTLLRRILHTPALIGEMTELGGLAPVNLCILSLHGVTSETSLTRVKERIKATQAEHLLSIGALAQLLEDSPHALMPQCLLTERPDRAASFLLEGQVVVLMDGAPQALAMPIDIWHLFHTSEDTTIRWPYGSFLRLVRMLGMLACVLLPGLFVAIVLFHPEALPLSMLTSILESQANVPLTVPAETFLMLVMFDLIIEAGTRVPGIVGSSLGTVSGLILGSAAVDANLIHPLLIIVVAVSSLGNYAIPNHELAVGARLAQLAMVAAACVAGLSGMAVLAVITLARLCALTSLGSPFMAPLAPKRRHNPDLLLRYPLWDQRSRTWLADPSAPRKGQGRMRYGGRKR